MACSGLQQKTGAELGEHSGQVLVDFHGSYSGEDLFFFAQKGIMKPISKSLDYTNNLWWGIRSSLTLLAYC